MILAKPGHFAHGSSQIKPLAFVHGRISDKKQNNFSDAKGL